MRTWWKHADLCIVGLLVAAVFAFRHGEEVLAAIGPRYLAFQEALTAKVSALTDQTIAAAPEQIDVAPPLQPPLNADAAPVFAPAAFGTQPQSSCHTHCYSPYGW